MSSEKIIGYKGFDKDFKCKDMQYVIGATYMHIGDISLCNSGFHFCEHPLDVFRYYRSFDSKFAEIEAYKVSDEKSEDSKRVCKRITIKSELSLKSLIDIGLKILFEKIDNTVAKAVKGSFIVLSEYDKNEELKNVKAFKVDNKKIKENIFYTLKNNKAVEVKE